MPNSLERITGPHIFIEGTDLTGKDTIGEHVKQHFGYDTMHRLVLRHDNPYEIQLKQLRPDEKEFVSSLLARSILFEIQNFQLKKPTLLVSSHALRGAAVEAGFKKPLAPVFEDLSAYFPHLDAHILLTADIEAKQRRLDGRPEKATSFDNKVYTDPEFVILMDSTIVRLGIDYFDAAVIDTSVLSIEESRSAVMRAITHALAPTTIKTVHPKSLQRDLKFFENELTNYENFVRRRYKVGV